MNELIRDHLKGIARLCEKYGVQELMLFGSVASGVPTPESDVDFLVRFDPSLRADFYHYFDLKTELEEVIGRPVDLVHKDSLKPILRDRILPGAQIVYENR